jgi:hypothetical protein
MTNRYHGSAFDNLLEVFVELTRLSVEGEKRKIAIATLYRLNSNSEYTDRFRLFGERSNTSQEEEMKEGGEEEYKEESEPEEEEE